MLNSTEQQSWDRIVQDWTEGTAEQAPPTQAPTPAGRRNGGRGVDDLPPLVVAGIWGGVLLVLLGAVQPGLVVLVLTAAGGLLWRWWPLLPGSGRPADPSPADRSPADHAPADRRSAGD